jgi:hypothetical protein
LRTDPQCPSAWDGEAEHLSPPPPQPTIQPTRQLACERQGWGKARPPRA